MSEGTSEVQETGSTDTDQKAPTEITGSVDDAINAPLDEVDDPNVLRKIARQLRNENKNARLKNKDRDEKLSEYEKWKQSQMSELEKARADLEAERKSHRDTLVESVAHKYGVDDEYREFLVGDTRDELEERAKKLGKLGKSKEEDSGGAAPNLLGGRRGNAVGKNDDGRNISADTEGRWFGEFMSGN